MKRWKNGAFASVLLAGILLSPVTHADSPIYVTIDGKVQNYDQPPMMVNNRTLVPLRGIFESLGATVAWNNDTQTATATKGNTTIILQIGSTIASKNGQTITLDVPAQLINDHTMVPTRFVSEAMGENVSWDDSSATVVITTPIPSTNQTPPSNNNQPSGNLSVQDIGKMSDRVVYIQVADQSGTPFASGSGFVVSNDGEILTNYHVIKGAYSAKIMFPNQQTYSTATVLAADPVNDLALLKINASNLPAVTIGDSSKVQLGDSVVAIGSPRGFQNSLSTGVISSSSRTSGTQTYLQTTAPIDHGSSGGALFNMKGEVIGVTSAGIDGSTAELGLAIPSNVVKTFLQQPQVSKNMGDQNKLSPNDLTNYLNSNYGTITYGQTSHVFHFNFSTKIYTDGSYMVDAVMYDYYTEFFDLMTMQFTDKTIMPALMYRLENEIHNKTGDARPYIGMYVVFDTHNQTSFPSNEVQYNSTTGIYHVAHNFCSGMMDYSSGYLTYQVYPGQTMSLKMN